MREREVDLVAVRVEHHEERGEAAPPPGDVPRAEQGAGVGEEIALFRGHADFPPVAAPLLLDGVDARVLAVAREDDPLVRSRAPLDDVVVHRAGGLRVAGVEALVEGIRVMASKVDH